MKSGTAIARAGVFAAALLSLGLVPARAEVAAQGEAGFRVEHSVIANVSEKKAWAAVLAPGAWWSSEHSWSGDARNMRLDAKLGGCWCERWKGGEVRHMSVVALFPGSKIVLEGGLGPLQAMGVSGAMTISVTPEGEGSKISFSYSVGGVFDPPAAALAPAVDGVIGEQAGRLKSYLEAE